MAKNTKKSANNNENQIYDVVIVGAGLMGLTLAGVLTEYNLNVALVERFDIQAMEKPEFDGRTTAISLGSKRVLEAANLWDKLVSDCCPIEQIRVADGDSSSYLHFDHKDVGTEPFGWIIENRLMRVFLVEALKEKENLTWYSPDEAIEADFDGNSAYATLRLKQAGDIKTRLIIGADGMKSPLREMAGIDSKGWDYKQSALVFCVDHECDHENIAVEHFLPEGPFAILPMMDENGRGHRSSVVWTVHNDQTGYDQAQAYMDLSEEEFNAVIGKQFGGQLGDVKLIGSRFSYPLNLNHAYAYTATRLALMGEAAHRMHPIAGQGLNLGMRDVALLAEMLVESKNLGLDLGRASMLQNYEKKRRLDNKAMMVATDILNKFFSNDIEPVKRVRQIGLGLVEKTPFAKKFFMKQAMGLSASPLPSFLRRGVLDTTPKLLKGEKL